MIDNIYFTLVAVSFTIHVSISGQDIESCGNIFVPCLSVKYAVMERSKVADAIIIHGTHANKTAVFHESHMELNRTIKLIGDYGTPVIMAKNGSLFTIFSSESHNIEVTLINITFRGRPKQNKNDDKTVFVYLQDAALKVVKCLFVSVPKPIHIRCDTACNFTIYHSKILNPNLGIHIEGKGRILTTVIRTDFIGNTGRRGCFEKALVYGRYFRTRYISEIFKLKIHGCKFSYFVASVVVYAQAKTCKLSIENSTFRNNINYLLNERFAPSVTVTYHTHALKPPSYTYLEFLTDSCLFLNNSGAEGSGILLNMNYKKFDGVIKNCTFLDNYASTVGGAVSFSRNGVEESKLFIEHSYFKNNTVDDHGNKVCQFRYWRTEGSGGALSFVASFNDMDNDLFNHITVASSTFIANSAITVGGTIYAFLAYVRLENVTIIPLIRNAFRMTEGTALSVTGGCILHGVKVELNEGYPTQKYAVRLDGRSLMDKETSFTCPVGTVIQLAANCDDVYHQFFSLSCVSCDIDRYNLNGSSFSNFSIDHPFCRKCPRGAICKHGRLKPLDNYWGYVDNQTGNLSFVLLPNGYGCSKHQCKRYDSCAENRQGTLCSSCMKGFSESMFSPECIKNAKCNTTSFFTLAAILAIIYLMFFIYKKNILRFLKTKLLSFMREESPYSVNDDRYVRFVDEIVTDTQRDNSGTNNNMPGQQTDTLGGLVKIVFYFYQIEALLDVYGGKIEHDTVKGIKSLVQNVFNFNFLEGSGTSSCAVIDASPVAKVMIRGIFVAAVLVAFFLLYIFYRIWGKKEQPCYSSNKHGFGDRVLAALFEVFLLSYTIITKIISSMLNCKAIGDKRVLYLQGDIQCYQTWQYGFIAAGLAWAIPFCLYVNLLPNLIREKHIGTKGLLFGCICPIPLIAYFLLKKTLIGFLPGNRDQAASPMEHQGEYDIGPRLEACGHERNSVDENYTGMVATVQQILCGPFNDNVNTSKYLSWDGVYIFRRLFIVSVFVFVDDPMYKLYAIMTGQILILLHHAHVRPYKDNFLNYLESGSLVFLVLINAMNLLAVFDFDHGVSEVGDKLVLLKLFAWIETVLHILAPTLITASLVILVAVNFVFVMIKILKHFGRAMMRSALQCNLRGDNEMKRTNVH